jgi:hypothetical protein
MLVFHLGHTRDFQWELGEYLAHRDDAVMDAVLGVQIGSRIPRQVIAVTLPHCLGRLRISHPGEVHGDIRDWQMELFVAALDVPRCKCRKAAMRMKPPGEKTNLFAWVSSIEVADLAYQIPKFHQSASTDFARPS